MHFVLHVQFMDTVRNTKQLPLKRPSVGFKDLQGDAVANHNQEAGQITSYYIMRFVFHLQFMDTVRNTKELPLKRP